MRASPSQSRQNRHIGRTHDSSSSSEKSIAGAECVSAPTEMKSTPVSAIPRTVCRFTPPLASKLTLPGPHRHRLRHFRQRHIIQQHHVDPLDREKAAHLLKGIRLHLHAHAGVLRAKLARPPRASAPARPRPRGDCPSPAPYRKARSDGSFRRRPSPPLFPARADPGVVFRVSKMRAFVPSTASTKRRVSVATPESRCTKLSATRSAVRIAETGPSTSSTVSPGLSAAPSSFTAWGISAESTRRKTFAAVSTPARVPACFAMICPRPRRSGETKYREVRSPAPRSSASAIPIGSWSGERDIRFNKRSRSRTRKEVITKPNQYRVAAGIFSP